MHSNTSLSSFFGALNFFPIEYLTAEESSLTITLIHSVVGKHASIEEPAHCGFYQFLLYNLVATVRRLNRGKTRLFLLAVEFN